MYCRSHTLYTKGIQYLQHLLKMPQKWSHNEFYTNRYNVLTSVGSETTKRITTQGMQSRSFQFSERLYLLDED